MTYERIEYEPIDHVRIIRFNRPERWTDIHKPIVAAVNGTAYAGGFEWACLATASVVSTSAITPIAGSIGRR